MEKSFREILEEQMAEETETVSDASAPSSPLEMRPLDWSALAFNLVNFPRETAKSSFSIASYKTRQDLRREAKPASATNETKGSATMTPPVTPLTQPKPETVIALSELKPADRDCVQVLLNLGASELKNGLSPSRLKQAHRRLAKRLHPDTKAQIKTAPPEDAALNNENFLKMQKAYKALSRALPSYIKDSADGNESASAPGFQRPNAA